MSSGVPATTPPKMDGAALLRKLRNIVDPPGAKGTWLKNLNDRQLIEVYNRLSLRQPSYKVAKIAQQEWGYQKTSNLKSLTRAVRAFRDAALGEIKAVAAGRATKQEAEVSKTLEKKAKRIGGKIDVLGSMSWVLSIQQERIEMLHSKEKASIPFKHTDGTIKTYIDGLKTYLEMSVQLGVQDEIPREFNMKVKHEFSNLLTTTVGAGGAKVVESLDRFLELAAQHSKKLVLNEEGTYVLEDQNAAQRSATQGE
jgi:hypothetical protein